jgi:hypothetical protein
MSPGALHDFSTCQENFMKRLRTAAVSAAVVSTLALAAPAAMAGTSSADATAPTQPTNLHVVSATNSDIEIAFTPGTEPGGSYVNNEVFLDDEPDQYPASYDAPDGKYDIKFNRPAGLIPGSSHKVRIRALDQSGNFTDSATITATFAPGDNTPPTTPTNLHVVSQNASGATIAWDLSTDESAITYFVDGGPCSPREAGAGSAFIPSYASDPVCGVLPGSTVSVSVRARDAWDNDSGSSNPVTIKF